VEWIDESNAVNAMFFHQQQVQSRCSNMMLLRLCEEKGETELVKSVKRQLEDAGWENPAWTKRPRRPQGLKYGTPPTSPLSAATVKMTPIPQVLPAAEDFRCDGKPRQRKQPITRFHHAFTGGGKKNGRYAPIDDWYTLEEYWKQYAHGTGQTPSLRSINCYSPDWQNKACDAGGSAKSCGAKTFYSARLLLLSTYLCSPN
jgi:hypothetical protein